MSRTEPPNTNRCPAGRIAPARWGLLLAAWLHFPHDDAIVYSRAALHRRDAKLP